MITILDLLISLLDKLGILGLMKERLLEAPRDTFHKLLDSLEALQVIYGLIDQMYLDYSRLQFDVASKVDQLDKLIALEADQRAAKAAAARAYYQRLVEIYQQHLVQWIGKHLSQSDQERINEAFQACILGEKNILSLFEHVADQIAKEATITRELLEKDQFEKANQRVMAFRTEMAPIRQKINTSMGVLIDLETTLSMHSHIQQTNSSSPNEHD
jgi:hypothetical protein